MSNKILKYILSVFLVFSFSSIYAVSNSEIFNFDLTNVKYGNYQKCYEAQGGTSFIGWNNNNLNIKKEQTPVKKNSDKKVYINKKEIINKNYYTNNGSIKSVDYQNGVLHLKDGNGKNFFVNLEQDHGSNDLDIQCRRGQVLKWDGDRWVCDVDIRGGTGSRNTDEQQLSLSGNILSLTNGGSVNLTTAITTNTDEQQISLTGDTLTLGNGTAADTTVDLSAYKDNTDTLQDLNCTAGQIAKWNGTAWTCQADVDTDTQLTEAEVDNFVANNGYLTAEVDGSVTNETVTASNFDTTTNILSFTEAGTNYTFDLSSLNNGGTDDQQLQSAVLNPATKVLTITLEDGGSQSVDLSSLIDDADSSTTNELVTNFTLNSNNLNLTDAGGTRTVDLSSYLDNTDNQTLTLASDTLSIANGNNVSLASYLDNTDQQQISLTGDTLTLGNGTAADTTVDLSAYKDNTDTLQDLNCTAGQIAKWNGTAWTCQADVDTDTQLTEAEVDNFVANNGYLTAEVDGSLTNELVTNFSVNSNNLILTDAGGSRTVNLNPYLDNTDNQILSLAGNTLSITNGNNVSLASYLDNTDNQQISLAGNILTLGNGTGANTTVDLSSYLDDTNTTYLSGNGLSLSGTTFSVNSPVCSGTEKLQWNGTSFVCSADIDTNTQLTESQVDTFVANNGYLTAEVDGSVTNEIQDLSLSGNTLSLSGDGTTVDLSAYVNTDVLAGLSCAADEFVKFNGTAWVCSDAPSGGDADWLQVGTTDAPDLNSDDIFTEGNVAIGADQSSSSLYVENTATTQTSPNMVGTSNETLYSFATLTDPSNNDWNFRVTDSSGGTVGTSGLGSPSNGGRRWRHDTNATPSSNVGPTAGVNNGTDTGYVYTEATNPTSIGDIFLMTTANPIDMSQDNWELGFYWNQSGGSNRATLKVQSSIDGGTNWVDLGEYGQNGPASSYADNIWNQETISLTSLAGQSNVLLRFRVQMPPSGTLWHNDFGLDEITITRNTLVQDGYNYGDTIVEFYNQTNTNDVDILRLSSDVDSTKDIKFRVDTDGDVYADGTSYIGGGADLAEIYKNSDGAEAGDVVVFVGDNRVEKSSVEAQETTAGVVSTKPGVVIGNFLEGVPVAMSGRVPVKFSAQNGGVQKGDYLTSSNNGYAVKAVSSGRVIGIAMEDQNSDGLVDVFVNVSHYEKPMVKTLENEESVGLDYEELIVSVKNSGVFNFIKELVFKNKVVFENIVSYTKTVYYNQKDFSGTNKIKAGKKGVKVLFSQEYLKKPNVLITNVDSFAQLIVRNITKTSFDVVVKDVQQEDVEFNWIAIFKTTDHVSDFVDLEDLSETDSLEENQDQQGEDSEQEETENNTETDIETDSEIETETENQEEEEVETENQQTEEGEGNSEGSEENQENQEEQETENEETETESETEEESGNTENTDNTENQNSSGEQENDSQAENQVDENNQNQEGENESTESENQNSSAEAETQGEQESENEVAENQEEQNPNAETENESEENSSEESEAQSQTEEG